MVAGCKIFACDTVALTAAGSACFLPCRKVFQRFFDDDCTANAVKATAAPKAIIPMPTALPAIESPSIIPTEGADNTEAISCFSSWLVSFDGRLRLATSVTSKSRGTTVDDQSAAGGANATSKLLQVLSVSEQMEGGEGSIPSTLLEGECPMVDEPDINQRRRLSLSGSSADPEGLKLFDGSMNVSG